MSIVKNVISVIVAIIMGFFAFGAFFTTMSYVGEAFRAAIYGGISFLLVGLIIGYLNPRGWMLTAVMNWGGILFGPYATITEIPKKSGDPLSAFEGLGLIFLPLGLALLGGYGGKILKKMRKDK